jgi:hypothetical protein
MRAARSAGQAAIKTWQARGWDDDAEDLREILKDLAGQDGR